MEHTLKNGKKITVREPVLQDAKSIIDIISLADKETKFLARNPNEFSVTVEQEKIFIQNMLKDNYFRLLVAEYEGILVGMSSIGVVNKYERYRHRAEVTSVVLKNYWGMGIGSCLMEECIVWANNKNCTQIELQVVADNVRAIKMYERFGFKKYGTFPNSIKYKDGTSADSYFMVKML